jgi:VIT1/CCC1 family predicted Fe2+/Mn2+ transporter
MDTLVYIIIGIFMCWAIFIVAGGVWANLYKGESNEDKGCVGKFIISIIIAIVSLMIIGMCLGIK